MEKIDDDQQAICRSRCLSIGAYIGCWRRGRSECSSGKKADRPRKPIVQAMPNTPIGCKLVGTVRGTKIWAGDCVGTSEIRGATPAEEVSSPPSAAAPTEKQ